MIVYLFKTTSETPSKKNSRIINTKTGRSFPNKRFTQWHAGALAEIIPQKMKNKIVAPLDTPLSVTLIFIHGDKRRRDSDNGASSILDLLTDAGILADDNYNIVQDLFISNYYQKGAAACYILIEQKNIFNDNSELINKINEFVK